MINYLAASLHTLGFTVQSRLRREETGATAVEYGIMVALIAVVIITAVGLLGGSINDAFESIQKQLGGTTTGTTGGTTAP